MTGILTIFGHETYILIDLGFAHSFISRTFAMHADREMRPLDCTLVVATLIGNSLLAKSVFRDCALRVGNNDMVADLILLDINDFVVILGMDWLANHYTMMNHFLKKSNFQEIWRI